MPQPMLELRNVHKSFGKTNAVSDVNLVLQRGEFVTLLGPSGSGKTTTLQMVAGLQTLTQGQILLEGQPIDPLPAHRRNIGMVFQHYALFPHMTIARNIAFPLEMRRMKSAEVDRHVKSVLELVGLPQFGDRFPRQLSGGQQQRVALARALVFKPPLLLLDEPLGALDKKLREQMQLEISRLHRELDASFIYVTHDQEEALVMSDRVAVFNDGRIEQIGPAAELYERPRTRFVANFIGESNFFTGHVVQSSGNSCLVATDVGNIRSLAPEAFHTGASVSVAVRPERIQLIRKSDPLPDENQVEATITDVIYLGQSRKYHAKLQNGEAISVLQSARDADLHSIHTGETVRFSWKMEHSTTLPGQGAER